MVISTPPVTKLTQSPLCIIQPSYADGLGEALGLSDALGETEGDTLALGDTDGEAEALGDTDALGDTEAEGDTLCLTVVIVGVCHNPSASTMRIPPERIIA